MYVAFRNKHCWTCSINSSSQHISNYIIWVQVNTYIHSSVTSLFPGDCKIGTLVKDRRSFGILCDVCQLHDCVLSFFPRGRTRERKLVMVGGTLRSGVLYLTSQGLTKMLKVSAILTRVTNKGNANNTHVFTSVIYTCWRCENLYTGLSPLTWGW